MKADNIQHLLSNKYPENISLFTEMPSRAKLHRMRSDSSIPHSLSISSSKPENHFSFRRNSYKKLIFSHQDYSLIRNRSDSERSGYSPDYKDQLNALDEAVCILSQIVSSYPSVSSPIDQTHFEGRRPSGDNLSSIEEQGRCDNDTCQTSIEERDGRKFVKSPTIQNRLDELNSSWKLEQTSIPSLLASIKTLQSNYQLVSSEADATTIENQSLRKQVRELKQSNQVLEKVSIKLYKENKNLKQKLRKVRDCASNIQIREKEQEERKVAAMVKLHEQILHASSSMESSENSAVATDDEGSIVSCASSFVTDSGMATVKYGNETKSNPNGVRAACKDDSLQLSNNHQKSKNIYKLSFPSGTRKFGLQFQKVTVEDKNYSRRTKRRNGKQPNYAKEAFLISGFQGFNDELNIPPALGARLIALDGESIEFGQTSYEDIKQKIFSMIASGSEITMTFRQDELTQHQKAVVQEAAARVMGSGTCGSDRENAMAVGNDDRVNTSKDHPAVYSKSVNEKTKTGLWSHITVPFV